MHSYVPDHFDLRNQHYQLSGSLQLREIFHKALTVLSNDTYDDIMRGLCTQPVQEFNNVFSEEMTEWLFKADDENFGMDIAALNIQRGRDHMIQGYTDYR